MLKSCMSVSLIEVCGSVEWFNATATEYRINSAFELRGCCNSFFKARTILSHNLAGIGAELGIEAF